MGLRSFITLDPGRFSVSPLKRLIILFRVSDNSLLYHSENSLNLCSTVAIQTYQEQEGLGHGHWFICIRCQAKDIIIPAMNIKDHRFLRILSLAVSKHWQKSF